jgi:hypothetical protein
MNFTHSPGLTASQATDLARYFLGGEWRASHSIGVCYLWQGDNLRFKARGWREVFRAAGVKLPARTEFASVGRRVVFGAESVATCVSNSMASRVAGALNKEGRGR